LIFQGNKARLMKTASKSRVRRDPSPDVQVVTEAGLGRPRDERIDTEVVSAVLNVLRTKGYGAVTIDGIARKVKRARTSLYRRWPSKRHLIAYAVVSEMGHNPAADTGVLRRDLEAAVETFLKAFAGPLGQALAGLVADMAQDDELAQIIRVEVLAARRKSMREAFDRARARGEVRPDLEIELVLDMLTGPFYYRTLFGHAPITRRMTRDVVSYVLRVVTSDGEGMNGVGAP
jgi:AcrR family transcriptional regulator